MLELPQRGNSNKYPKHMLLEVLMQYSCIISHWLSPLELRFRDSQNVTIAKFVVVSSADIKRVDCIAVYMANSVDPDQMQSSAASDLGLHGLQRPICFNT